MCLKFFLALTVTIRKVYFHLDIFMLLYVLLPLSIIANRENLLYQIFGTGNLYGDDILCTSAADNTVIIILTFQQFQGVEINS